MPTKKWTVHNILYHGRQREVMSKYIFFGYFFGFPYMFFIISNNAVKHGQTRSKTTF